MTLVKRLRRMTFRPRIVCAAVLASFAVATVHAEDIDIFSANSPDAHHPNVLIIIDNSSNWSATMTSNASCTAAGYPGTKFGAEMCALTNVINGLNANMRVGLMMFAESGNNGAYVRFGIRDMTDQNKTALKSLLNNMVQQGTGTDNSGSNQPYGKTMFEAFKYFGGYTNQAQAAGADNPGAPTSAVAFGPVAFAGGNSNNAGTYRRDYPNNNAANNRAAAKYGADVNYAYVDNNSDTYVSPIIDGCAKNFIIFISNGNPGTGGDASSVPAPMSQIMTTLNVTPTQLPPSPATETHASKMDEMARFLYETDVSPKAGIQNVQTFTVGVYAPQNNGSISNTDQQMLNLMQSAATYGGGKFCSAKSADEVATCINSVFNELQAVNSVFVSSSLPVSVNAQGTFINQVYMGMFRPDKNSSPRWMGNLKEYKIDKDSLGNLFLADSVDVAAINSTTGFVSPNAKSFWSAGSTFWANNMLGTPPSVSDLPDGEVVEKGGAAQKLRVTYPNDLSLRNMFTCPAAGCAAGALSTTFTKANIAVAANLAAFGAADTTELGRIVEWIRGVDNVNGDPCAVGSTTCATWTSAEKGPGWPTIVRPSIHGDVLHTRPVVLNYANIGPYVFYAANDGVLRAIKGGRDPNTDGKESWSFVAPEFYGKYKRLRTQLPTLVLPTVVGAASAKDYFFDGPIGSYQDANAAYIFPTARRGGRLIYAFDVTDPNNPKFMWKKTNADLPELGQTWSEPKAVKVKASTDPVIIFGAGYDPAEDSTPVVANTMGRAVYVLNAKTGALIKTFTTSVNGGGSIQKSIPSDVAVIDRDLDTYADRVYVGDTGGNIWRMDIDDPNPANWKMEKFAALGSTFKFLYRPDVIPTSGFDIVLAGTGDREKPLVLTSQDYFFMLKDTATGKDGSALTTLGFADLVVNGSPTSSTTKGWYLQLATGEKVVNAPLTIGGITFFSTNQPTPPPTDGSCPINLGTARAYAVDFLTGGAGIDRNGDGSRNASDLAKVMPGGGLSPSPVGGVIQLDDGSTSAFCIGCGGTTGKGPSDAEKPPVTIPKVRKKTYWNVGTDK